MTLIRPLGQAQLLPSHGQSVVSKKLSGYLFARAKLKSKFLSSCNKRLDFVTSVIETSFKEKYKEKLRGLAPSSQVTFILKT